MKEASRAVAIALVVDAVSQQNAHSELVLDWCAET